MSFCRITGQSRGLPKPNYFPLLPPISPADAKKYRTSGCRITCNFNPDHHYSPITKLISESTVKCRITEKSIFEYKFFIQPVFVGDKSDKSSNNKISESGSNEFFFYELDGSVLVVPKSVEKDLNRGAIKDVQVSLENNKIGFRYINTIKEYDLSSESTDKFKALAPLRGKGLRKNVRKRRKKSALLGDLKSIFEQKERLAEIAEKKASEKIQPDASKIELVTKKLTFVKTTLFGYMDPVSGKFKEIIEESDVPRNAVKGQMYGGVFTEGERINDIFIEGKYSAEGGVFTPGFTREDGEFVPGTYVEKEVNGKMVRKFVPGKVMNGTWTPGQMMKTKDGSSSVFIPGQVLLLDNQKKFVPGLLVEEPQPQSPPDTNREDSSSPKPVNLHFVPAKVEEVDSALVFKAAELVETTQGLKWICDDATLDKDSFQVQAFDTTFDFDLEDVRAAAAICDTVHEFLRVDNDGDTRSLCTTLSGANPASRKASIDFLGEEEEVTTVFVGDTSHLQNLQNGFETVLAGVKAKTKSIVTKICEELGLSPSEMEAVLQETMGKQASFCEEILEIDSTLCASDLIFEKVSTAVASLLQPSFARCSKKSKPETVARILKEVVAQEILESSSSHISSQKADVVVVNFDKAKQTAHSLVMTMSAKKASKSLDLGTAEKVILEVIKESAAESASIMNHIDSIMDAGEQTSSSLVTTLVASQKARQDAIVAKCIAGLGPNTKNKEEMLAFVSQVLEQFGSPEVLKSICDRKVKLQESPSAEKVIEDCKKLLVEGYHHMQGEVMGESEGKAADLLKDHVETQINRDLNEAMLIEAMELAKILGKTDVVKELESLLQDDIHYETVVNDSEVLFILRQLVILKKLMGTSTNKDATPDTGIFTSPSSEDQALIRDAQMLTEYVFAQEERERYSTPPTGGGDHPVHAVENHYQMETTSGQVYTQESSSFFSMTEGTTQAKRARLNANDNEDDDMLVVEPCELLDNSFARHKIEVAKSRHGNANASQSHKKTKISLKSAEELQATTSEQLAQINREATLRELIETEEEFVRDLGWVIDHYYKALESGNKLAKYRDLFGSLKPIYEFHQGILLEGFRYYINEPKMIGRTFLRLERYFDKHAEYISDEEPAAQAVLQNDLEIAEYFEDLTLKLGDEKNLTDHLKLPHQRINDYQLILQDLIDIQRILKEDCVDLEKALDLLLSIPQKISDKKFLANIEGFHGNVFHLGRLLRHDWFTVTRSDTESSEEEVKQRYVFLFKSRIIVTKVRKISEARSVFILKDIIKLPEYTLESLNERKFLLKSPSRSYTFESPPGESGALVGVEWHEILVGALSPEVAAAARTQENIKQLKREGSLRRSRQTSLEPRRVSASSVDIPPPKLATISSGPGATESGTIEEGSSETAPDHHNFFPEKTPEEDKKKVPEVKPKEKVPKKEAKVVKKEAKKSEPEPPEPTPEELKTLRRRSSVILASAAEMSSEKPPVFSKPLRSVECEPGDNATFECTTEGQVIINWLKGNRPLNDALADRVKITSVGSKHSLTLLNCRDEDGGLYTAKITNEKMGVATSSAVLTVHELTPEERQKKTAEMNSPHFLVKFKDTELLKDTRVSFMFVCKGNPAPVLTFYQDGMVLSNNDRTKVIKQPDDTYEFCIERILEEDAGEYKVVATNKHGSAEASATVRVVDEKELFKGIEAKHLLNPGEEPVFDWFMNGRPFTPDEKLKVLFKDDEDTLALIFQHVTPDDAGLYTCVAQTSSGKISCSAELTVQGAIHQLLREPCPPSILAELTDTEVSVGGSAMMELKVSGFPKPTVKWFKNGKEELVAGGRIRFLYEDDESIALIIKSVTKEDAGLYVVKAINDLGEVETKGRLIVKAPPRFVKKMTDMACMTEEKLAMDVIVEGSPKPEVKWYKDGQLIVASERIKFTELEDGRFQITIERVTLEDSGAYSVVASNAIGQMSEFWNLVAQQPAKIIRKLPAEHTTDLGAKGVALNFSVQGVPEPKVVCTNTTSGKALKVDALGGGEYRVVFDTTERQNIQIKAEVKNDFGSDSCTSQVWVRRSAQITSKLSNIEAKEGDDVTLKVKIDAYPKPTKLNWFIDGVEVSGKKYEKSDSGDEYSLKIKGVERAAASNKLNVTLKAENELGKDECSASITIKSKPKIKKGLDAKYRLVEGSKTAELSVDVDSATFPEPKGSWYHNGQEVSADARIKITKKSSETYNLAFTVVKHEDVGEWSFKAENEVGEVWSKTIVIVEGKPSFTKGLPERLEVLVSEKMELDVMVQDFCEENVKITWTLDSDVKLESKEEYQKDKNAASSKIVFVPTAGCQRLTVTAKNKHGETETRSELVQVNLEPPVIKKPLEKEVFIKDGQKGVKLTVEVEGMPPPTLTWLHNGEQIQKGSNSNELLIPVFSMANVGQYSVEAVNLAGAASSAGAVKMLQSKPAFLKGLEPAVEFKEGLEDLVLSVDIDGSPIPTVVWMKDGIPISAETDPRVSITTGDGKSTLRVKNIDPKDKGRYTVALKNPNGAAESSSNVSIKPTPRAPVLLEPLDYPKDVNKKERLQIKTKIDGEPMPNVTFLHNGKPLAPHLWKVSPDGSVVLTIDNVQPENAGVYSLLLDNEAGKQKVDTEPISVHEPPARPGIEPPLGTVKVVEGLPFAFRSTIKGYPPPELTLQREDGSAVPDFKYDPVAKTFEYSKPVAEMSDAGALKLTAKNPSGTLVSDGKLDVVSRLKEGPTYVPKFLHELADRTVDEGNELLLMAKIDGNPLPTIRWEFNGSVLSPEKYPQTFDGEKASLRIPIAEREHQGLFKCVLTNSEGTSESGSNVTVNRIYKPPAFAQKFTDQEQIPACDSKFGARISGVPLPTAKWFKGTQELSPGDKYKIKQEGDLVQLQVRNCTDADKGIYTCVLSNKEGGAECKAKLDVVKELSHKPRGEIPYFLKTIGHTEVYPGMTAKFTACVGGTPEPEYEWFRGRDKIFETERVRFERDGVGSGLLRLIIKDVDLGDLNDYTLRIWNEHGEAECTASLKFDSLADLNKQKLGDLYSGYQDTRPTAIPNRPLITNMTKDWATLKWSPCLPHASRIPCTYMVESCPASDPDNWTPLYKGLKNTYCDINFPNPNTDYKFRIRVEWGPHHLSEPSPYAITMRSKFDTRPPQWKPQLVPTIPRSYDLSRPPHEGYTHGPRFLNRENDYQYAQLGHPSSLYFYVYGYPKPTLSFFRDGVTYTPTFTYLDNGLISVYINRMTEEWEGEFECEARNPHGIARQRVGLRRADHPRFLIRPQEVYAMARRGGKIWARIYGIPVPEIRIYKDWHLLPLTSETRVRLVILDVEPNTVDVIISIEETMSRDEGLYSIVASNVAGSIHSSAMIHVEEVEADYYWHSNLKGKDVRLRSLPVRNYYDWGEELGRGTQGVTHHVVERASGGSFAAKTMVTRYDPKRKGWIEAEYNAWNGLNHRHISRLYDAFYHDDTYTLVGDICSGGDLLHSFISRDSFTEYQVCHFMRQVLEALEYLHVQTHTAHLSLTPLDLLLTHIHSDNLRLIDFSLARKHWNKSLEYGHPEFVSPEIVKGDKHVGPWCDMWAVGIITYVLLSGHSPFLGGNDMETLENVKNGTWTFGDRFSLISDRGRDFISKLLVYDFKDRLDVTGALAHSWFHTLTEEETTQRPNILKDIHSSYYYKLVAWNENASCRTIFRRNPLETAYTDPSRMVYPPNYNEDNDYKIPTPVTDHLKLNGYPRPDIEDFVSESHYQSGDETYLLQLRDTDFPARLRQYMKVAASHSPSFMFQVYNHYCERNIPVIRERRKFTEVMDEEVDDEKRTKINNDDYIGHWNSEPRRLRHEVGTRLDIQAEANAYRALKQDGKEPVFREKPNIFVNVKLGSEVSLKVVCAGDPVPGIQWFKNDGLVMSSGGNKEITEDEGSSTLTLKEIHETDLTNYKIVARNKSGQMTARFRLRLCDDPIGAPVPESINYEIESSAPVNISTEQIVLSSPCELVSQGKFGSVILGDKSRLLKACTETEYKASKGLAHRNLFTAFQAVQVGSSILLEDNCLSYEGSANLLSFISSLDLYTEQLLMNFVAQILDGLQYLHWQGLALLNMEPGNVVVCKGHRVKLVDFSTAQPVLKIGSRVDCLTEPEFTAPEVLNSEAQVMPQTDTWSVGVLLYILLSGVSPFLAETDEDTKSNVTYVRFRFEHLYKNVSQEATRLIMLIFKRSPLKRPTADECLEHRWFQLSDSLSKKREKSIFDTTKIKEYYAHYLEKKKSVRAESISLQDFTSKYGTISG